MLKNVLNIEGVHRLSKEEKRIVKAGTQFNSYEQCLSLCGGNCTYTGRCFWMIE